MMASRKRWAWALAWALVLGCMVSFVLLGRVAADDDDDDDDQTPEVIITETGGDTRVTEGGAGDVYTIVLSDVPMATVTVTLSAPGEIDVEPSSVAFTLLNWDSPRQITVTAVDDDVAEGMRSRVVAHAVSSLDSRYDDAEVPHVVVQITDDDVAGVSVEPPSLAIAEGGPAGSYRMRLTSQPRGAVTVMVEADGAGLAANPAQLAFDGDTWATPQSVVVTVADDETAMGPRDGVVRHAAASADAGYDGIAIAAVAVSVSDDDLAGVSVAPTTVQVEEDGATDSYEVTLASRPTADVTIRVSSDGQTRTNPTALTFVPSAWNAAHQVTVTAEDDGVEEGDHQGIIDHSIESADAAYDGIAAPSVTALILDKKKPGVRIVESIGSTRVTEGGQGDTYTIELLTEPRASVLVTIQSDTQVTVEPSAITFHPWDWDDAETIIVRAVDDEVAEGTHTSILRHSASSFDDGYAGIDIADVSVRVTDNDTAGVSVLPTSLQVAEGGATAPYQVALTSRPTADVTVRIATDGQTRTTPTALTFSPSTWRTSRIVTVAADDDGVVEGDHQSTISHSVESADALYDRIGVAAVTVAVADRVVPAEVRITESGGSTHVTEGGPGDSYEVELASRPTADATIHISTDGETEVEPSQITFNSTNWRDARLVAVSAADDRRAEGAHASTIRHRCTSADRAYDDIAIPDVVVTVTDNDVARVSVSPTQIDMVEGDAGAGYALTLESEPAGSVTVRISTDGLTAVSPSEVRFGPEDWQEPRWIAVTVADDATQQGTRVSEVRHSVESDDAVYAALSVAMVAVTVHDNERADVIVSSSVDDITARDGSTSFGVRLASRPAADVMIPLVASCDRVHLSLSAVRLTRDTWQAGVQVIVSANVDPSWYGEEVCTIALGPTSSADKAYDGRDPEDVVVRLRIEGSIQTLCIPLSLRAWPPVPGVPALQAIDNADGRGDYTVAWSAADRADGYVLQEAVDAGFATAQELYAGPDVAHSVSGRGPGRYYYRVAATNAWGMGAWSGPVAVDVRWEREPNDDALTQANGPLVPDVTYHGALASGSDVQDYYRVELGAAGRIEVWLDGVPAGQNYDLVVRDASLGLVGYSAELDNAGEHILTGTLSAGTYYFQVYQRSGGGSGEPYALRYAVR